MKFPIAPQTAGYAQTPGSEKAEVQLEGGRAWRRKTKAGASSLVEVSWILSASAYDFFWAFFRSQTERGVSVYQMDLILEGANLVDVDCYFVGEPALSAKNGDTYTVTATLEVVRPVDDPALDAAIIDGYITYGDSLASIFDRLAIFANSDMPDTIGAE